MSMLISVIVPIYNVEKYLLRCIESIRNQSYSNLEIILVDDGSTDCSGELADKVEREDKRIKVIHKTNGGLSDARNIGIEAAKGDYLCFIDSDDYIHYDMIRILYQCVKKYSCELAVCESLDIYGCDVVQDREVQLSKIKCNVLDNINAMKFWYKTSFTNPSVAWNKIYSKTLFENLRFEKGRLHEDEIIMHKIFITCKHIVYIWEPLYYYCHRGDSITGKSKSYNLKRLDVLYAMENRLEYFKNMGDSQLIQMQVEHYCDILMGCYIDIKNSSVENRALLKKILNKIKKLSKQWNIDFKHKLKVKLFFLSPIIYEFLRVKSYQYFAK